MVSIFFFRSSENFPFWTSTENMRCTFHDMGDNRASWFCRLKTLSIIIGLNQGNQQLFLLLYSSIIPFFFQRFPPKCKFIYWLTKYRSYHINSIKYCWLDGNLKRERNKKTSNFCTLPCTVYSPLRTDIMLIEILHNNTFTLFCRIFLVSSVTSPARFLSGEVEIMVQHELCGRLRIIRNMLMNPLLQNGCCKI